LAKSRFISLWEGELMAQTFKVGLVGAGFIARFQTLALRQVRGIEIAGITALRARARINWHFGASAGWADARSRWGGP
jgi:ornithine cyclodeaminase/alanine dehydrogenase-like protein (mu-crystallin family)